MRTETVTRQMLPIDPLLAEVIEAMRESNCLVIEAPPGAGKTTRVPPALLDAVAGQVWVAQPRRLAARLAAQRVAKERGEAVGLTVGYQVRFENRTSVDTRLRYVTEGILMRRLLDDHEFAGIGAIVLDEFHERHLAADFLLSYLRSLQQSSRRDLRLVVMSATLDAEPVATFLGNCRRLRSEGKRFAVEIEHASQPDDRPIDKQVVSALHRLLASDLDGDVLVFLPGAREIRFALAGCRALAKKHNLDAHVLHGSLPVADQDRAIAKGPRRKIILSTNVAETSVTIEGVAVVVDSGLARVAHHSPWSGLSGLSVSKISRASAAQRAGRAGRTRAGRCVRLYSKHDHDTRPEHDKPEIQRLDLTEIRLSLARLATGPWQGVWFDAPPEDAALAAEQLLGRLGALAKGGTLSAIGGRMLRFPLHPRLSRVLVAAEELGVERPACAMVALLSEPNLLRRGHARADTTGPSDVLHLLELFEESRRKKFAASVDIDIGAARAVHRTAKQLEKLCQKYRRPPDDTEDALMQALLAGFPDRVARRRAPGSTALLLCQGGSATLADSSIVRDHDLVVVVDAEVRKRLASSAKTNARQVSAIRSDWLLDWFPEQLREETSMSFEPQRGRVEVSAQLFYENVALDDSRREPNGGEIEQASTLLADSAIEAGLGKFLDDGALDRWRTRLTFVEKHCPDSGIAALTQEQLADAVRRTAVSFSCTSLAKLRKSDLLAAIKTTLSHQQQALLGKLAPEFVALPGRKRAAIHYHLDRPPHVASRLQDFFGLRDSPTVAGGRVPLVLHLLAPNQRALQVTTDLASFWKNHYPALRKQLARRYPKHKWPEKP